MLRLYRTAQSVLLMYIPVKIRVPALCNSLIQVPTPHRHGRVRRRRLTMHRCKVQSTELKMTKGQVHAGIDEDSDGLHCL